MKYEKQLADTATLMFVLNLAILLYYSLICCVTPYHICASFSAYDFLTVVRALPRHPWRLPLLSLSLYLLLCLLCYGKRRRTTDHFPTRLTFCILEIVLCVGIMAALDFYYSGIALLVLADLVHYVRDNRFRLCFMAVLIFLFAFGRQEILFPAAAPIPFSAWLRYYNQTIQGLFTSLESVMTSINVLLFVFYMILLFTGQKEENIRIGNLNRQLNEANAQLRDYAIRMERMTEIRERNRLAREIHDTLGHTLTGIIMSADASLVLLEAAPEESRKRLEVIAQTAREGLNDVRRSINALRPDALERQSLGAALVELVENFQQTTSAVVQYEQEAGPLDFSTDETDTLYRIVQEGLTNAVRHGHAALIHIRLTRQADSASLSDIVTVDIRDNGVGQPAPLQEGFGLRHMRERLTLLGGSLLFGNQDGGGFFITATIPIRQRPQSGSREEEEI